MKQKNRKKLLLLIAAFVAAIIIIILAAPIALPPFLSSYLTERLQSFGFTKADVSVSRLGLNETRVAVRLTESSEANKFDAIIVYSPLSLIQMRAQDISIDADMLRIDMPDDKSIKIADAVFKGGESRRELVLSKLPIEKVSLKFKAIQLYLPGKAQPITVSLDGTISSLHNNLWKFEGKVKAVHPFSETSTVFDGNLSLNSTTFEAAVSGRLTDMQNPEMVVPLDFSGSIAGSLNDAISFKAKAATSPNNLQITLSGRHHMQTKEGRGKLDARLTLSPYKGGLAETFPWLAYRLDTAEGTATAAAEFSWGDKYFTSGGSLNLNEMSAKHGTLSASGINGKIVFDSLFPPAAAPQRISIKTVQAAIPLSNLTVVFGIKPSGLLIAKEVKARWEGSSISVKPFIFNPTERRFSSSIEIHNLEIQKLAELAGLDNLKADGILEGSIPVVFRNGIAFVKNGLLQSTGPGSLRYTPAKTVDLPAHDIAIITDALSDFRYDKLLVSIDGMVGGELNVGFRIAGRNPTFYDGKPVSLNVSVIGALDVLLRRNLELYSIPEALQKKILKQQ